MTDTLKLRNSIKRKKPSFLRQDAHKMKRLKHKWRKPKGSDSKMRWGVKGYRRCVQVGWGSPKAARFLNREGKMEILVNCLQDIENMDPKDGCAILASGLGQKKKVEIVKKCTQKGISIGNLKDPEVFLKKNEEGLAEKKKKKEEKAKVKETKEKEKKKHAEKKEDLAEKVLTDEEKKELEKKEKDKILTTRES